VVLAAALAFLAGAVGFALGAAQDEPAWGSDLDAAFMLDMAHHHEQAVTMSILATENATDLVTRNFARDVLIFQRYELGLMDAYLARMDVDRAEVDPDREAMGWMGTPVPLDEMVGLASDEELDALRDARGLDADVLFLELLIRHHEGGVHMAEDASVRAEAPEVRRLAEYQATTQRAEIAEYRSALDRMVAARDAGEQPDRAPADLGS
jgi:uncharacterized protein (DUF305 family)